MMMSNPNKKATGDYPMAYKKTNYNDYHNNNGHKKQGKFDRTLLPISCNYYSSYFPGLSTKSGWVSVSCPFHADRTPSLSINLTSGGFKCHACGVKGGDILAFQMIKYSQTFIQAAKALGAWRTCS